MYQNQHDVLGCVLQAKILYNSTVRVSKSWNPRLHQYPAGTPPKAIPKNLAKVASTRYRTGGRAPRQAWERRKLNERLNTFRSRSSRPIPCLQGMPMAIPCSFDSLSFLVLFKMHKCFSWAPHGVKLVVGTSLPRLGPMAAGRVVWINCLLVQC